MSGSGVCGPSGGACRHVCLIPATETVVLCCVTASPFWEGDDVRVVSLVIFSHWPGSDTLPHVRA